MCHWFMKRADSQKQCLLRSLILNLQCLVCVSGELQAGCGLFFTSCLILQLMMKRPDAFVCLILLAVPDNMSSWTAGSAWSAGYKGEVPALRIKL